jgi:hypothetical protein
MVGVLIGWRFFFFIAALIRSIHRLGYALVWEHGDNGVLNGVSIVFCLLLALDNMILDPIATLILSLFTINSLFYFHRANEEQWT